MIRLSKIEADERWVAKMDDNVRDNQTLFWKDTKKVTKSESVKQGRER